MPSPDGTEIGVWTTGSGPPLVVVHGGTADHNRWSPLLPHLRERVTVHAIDRRGRGASGDAAEYSVEREFEDIAAVVDDAAAGSGSDVDLFGHSFGGVCALGGATLTSRLRKLVLYEPPTSSDANTLPSGLEERLDAPLASGDREGVLETFFTEVVGMPPEELAILRSLPAWSARVAAAPTITREIRAITAGAFDPERVRAITAPTLLLLGGDSSDLVKQETESVVAALPDTRVVILEGQQHVAIDRAPELVAQEVLAFLRE